MPVSFTFFNSWKFVDYFKNIISDTVIRTGAQVPITLLTNYRNAINGGFDTLVNGIGTLQRVFSGGSSADESVDDADSDSRVDVPPPSSSFDFDTRRRFRF